MTDDIKWKYAVINEDITIRVHLEHCPQFLEYPSTCFKEITLMDYSKLFTMDRSKAYIRAGVMDEVEDEVEDKG